jgi:medium-chain acyl-[acyl-carrier-protein] hydrolase
VGRSKWFLVTRPKPQATYRLFCFPYAGGSASIYTSWGALLPDTVELVAIQPPGRANRLSEGLMTSVREMGAALAQQMPSWLDRPYLIYGHSLGAIVGFEMLHALASTGLPMPLRFFSAARRSPQTTPLQPPIHDYPLEEFKAELRKLNGTPEHILQNQELMQIFVPILRADLQAAHTYHRAPDVQLDCEVSLFSGARDDKVTPEEIRGWQAHFRKPADFRSFPGGHFFMEDDKQSVVNAICESLPIGVTRSVGISY